ncbi:MAG TPA: M20/M25/M40 family metallo-hydrolase [Acidimicrobiales bacterium]|nr:M20/M25/M40 family metallo-hydrolase [Acidimicrobiales bacterium]
MISPAAPSRPSEEDLVELLSKLVSIDSSNPWLVPGGAGESGIARYMQAWLDELGVRSTVDEYAPERTNLLATVRGARPGPTLAINVHCDTVGYANWADLALTPRRDGERLVGLGAADNKAGCAVALLLLRALAAEAHSFAGTFAVAFVADEEGLSTGTERLLEDHEIDYCIVLEPFNFPSIIVEHQGFGWIDITVRGRAAHGSAPDKGVDAIIQIAEVLTRLHEHDDEVFGPTSTRLSGRTVFHASTIRGGTDYATYPSDASVGIEIGTQPGEHIADRLAEIDEILDIGRKRFPDLDASVTVRVERDPFFAEGHTPILDALRASALMQLGRTVEPSGVNAWTDAALMQNAGVPTVLLGPTGGNLHAPDEWVSIPDTLLLYNLLLGAIHIILA